MNNRFLRFFAIIRRMMLGGFLFFLLLIFYKGKDLSLIINQALQMNSAIAYFNLYLIGSLILYLILAIISTILVRNIGAFSNVHKKKSWASTFVKCIGSDIVAPFKCIGGFVTALIGKVPDNIPQDLATKSKILSIIRFLWMILWATLCVVFTFLLQ